MNEDNALLAHLRLLKNPHEPYRGPLILASCGVVSNRYPPIAAPQQPTLSAFRASPRDSDSQTTVIRQLNNSTTSQGPNPALDISVLMGAVVSELRNNYVFSVCGQ
jgi:hypothetical protein